MHNKIVCMKMHSPCEYKAVTTCKNESEPAVHNNKDSWKTFWRQMMIAASFCIFYFNMGMCLGAPTVIIPQLRREANSTDAVSTEMAQWLSSIFGYANLPWIIILPITMQYYGRKITFTLVCIAMIGVFTFFIFSNTPTHMLIAEFLLGMPSAACMTLALVIATEYIDLKYRGGYLTFISASFNWGIWIANAIGTYFYWKYIMVLGLTLSLFTLNVFFWPKTAFWLASKGRFEECRRAHRWLIGKDEISERNLEKLIASQVEHRKKRNDREKRRTFKNVISFLWRKEFYKPVLLGCLLSLMCHLSGKQVCTMYAIDIIKGLTNSESAAYTGMLILDGVSVFFMYVGCVISKYCKRRTMLFVFGTIAGLFLLMLSLHCYLIKLNILSENTYVAISLLIGFSVAISLGPLILMSTMLAEMLPLNYKSEALTLVCLVFAISQSTVLKLSPYVFLHWGSHIAFLFYGISVSVCVSISYKYLPETKSKTLYDIEEFFKKS